MSDVNLYEKLRQRHRLVRAGFVAQGSSLQAWCIQQGFKRQNVDKALMTEWTGPKATSVLAQVLEAAKVAP